MKQCPECQRLFANEISECPHCHQKLERSSVKDTEETFIGLYSLPGEVYAKMVKEVLENEGITCILKQDVVGSSLLVKGTNISGGSYQLFVKRKDQDRAQNILHGMMDHI